MTAFPIARTYRRKSWRRMKNSIVRNWQDLLRVFVFSPDWTYDTNAAAGAKKRKKIYSPH
jgi:hypothetical protein